MAPPVTPGGSVPGEATLYRALNPRHLENGLPGDNHFVMKQTHPIGDGVSTGILGLISLQQLRDLQPIKEVCGECCGVAELAVDEILAPVLQSGISVSQQDAPDWGNFAGAHAVITGYQVWHGNAGKRQIRDFQRHLVKLARKRFYPSGLSAVTETP